MNDLPVGDPVPEIEVPTAMATEHLKGNHVVVRRPDPDNDVHELYERTHGDPAREQVWTYMPYGPFATEAEFRVWLGVQTLSADPWYFTITTPDDRPIGMAAMLNIDLAMRRLELGHIWYVPEAQRTEANTEATYLMLREAFERYRCRRVEWKCDALNAASRRAALRLGFTYEGVFRHHLIVKGRNRDTAWFAMTDRDWPRVRAVLEAWLGATPPERHSLTGAMAESLTG
jgi:RimJ/RimL family protein N-acetyltransferase